MTSNGQEARLLRPPCDLEIVIPARNEERRLPRTLTHTVRYLEQRPYSAAIVVVDNGSADRTSDLVRRLPDSSVPVYVVGCSHAGKGAAVRRGMLTSRARFVGYMDADLATPIETLDLVVPLLSNGFRAVVGSRRVDGAVLAVPPHRHRRAGSMLFRAAAHRMVPGVADTQCGFKFFDGALARSVAATLRVDGFAFDIELLRAIADLGVPIKEIPVVWSDVSGSTLHGVRDGVRATAQAFALAYGRAR